MKLVKYPLIIVLIIISYQLSGIQEFNTIINQQLENPNYYDVHTNIKLHNFNYDIQGNNTTWYYDEEYSQYSTTYIDKNTNYIITINYSLDYEMIDIKNLSGDNIIISGSGNNNISISSNSYTYNCYEELESSLNVSNKFIENCTNLIDPNQAIHLYEVIEKLQPDIISTASNSKG